MSARWSTTDDHAAAALAHPPRADRGVLCHAGAVLLGAEDLGLRREYLLLPAQYHPARAASVLLRGRLVCDPLRALLPQQRGGIGADDRSQCRAERNGRLLADANVS